MTAKKITNRSFFTCSAEELAPKLLGKILCHKESTVYKGLHRVGI